MSDTDLHDISPELALVSPELGRLLRAELPDRPWEWWRAREVESATPIASAREAVVAREPGIESVRIVRAGTSARLEAFAGRAVAVVLLSLVLLIVSAVGASELKPQNSVFLAAPKAPPASPTESGVSRAAAVVLEPGAVFVFGATGRFRVSDDGRRLSELRMSLGCAHDLRLTDVSLDGVRFTSRRTWTTARGRVSVAVKGRFTGIRSAVIEVIASGGTCTRERLLAVAERS